jgi:hypothetical protein
VLQVERAEALCHQRLRVRVLLQQEGQVVDHVPDQGRRLEDPEDGDSLARHYAKQLREVDLPVDQRAEADLILLLCDGGVVIEQGADRRIGGLGTALSLLYPKIKLLYQLVQASAVLID